MYYQYQKQQVFNHLEENGITKRVGLNATTYTELSSDYKNPISTEKRHI